MMNVIFVLNVLIQVAGHGLVKKYGRQFKKIMIYLYQEYMKKYKSYNMYMYTCTCARVHVQYSSSFYRVESVTAAGEKQPLVELQLFLEVCTCTVINGLHCIKM